MDICNDFFNGKVFYGAIGMENMKSDLCDVPCNDRKVTAYHVFSTKPFYARDCNKGKAFSLADFELKTAELSALCWRRYNGPIYLVTDSAGEEYFRKSGLEYAYDGIWPVLEQVNHGIDPARYWSSGKIEALNLLEAPCAIVDIDLIVWKPLDFISSGLITAHIEHLDDFVYPPFSYFNMSPRYSFPREWDESTEALNSAFLYIADPDFKKYYTGESIRFMQYERCTVDDGIKCTCFAEQRVLALCAAASKIGMATLVDYDNITAHQDNITHIWSAKRLLYENDEIRNRYIDFCNIKIEQLKGEAK